MSKIQDSKSRIESLDAYDCEEDGFIDGAVDVDRPLATFCFEVKPASAQQPAGPSSKTSFSFGGRVKWPGATPVVDGEAYTIKRCYQYRPSTVRKLNELKANHSDVNVYLNTIIDQAILHYYEHIFHRSPTI